MPTEDMVPRATSTPFYIDQEEPEFDFAMPATPTVNFSSTISTGTFSLVFYSNADTVDVRKRNVRFDKPNPILFGLKSFSYQ